MGFKFNGVSSKDMKIKARLTSWQASPSLRNNYITVPGKAGVSDFGCDSAERTLALQCNVYPQFKFSTLVDVLDRMVAWLDPTEGLKRLILDEVPDRYFMARLSDGVDVERLIRSAGSFELKFICPDPYAYAVDDEAYLFEEEGEHTAARMVGNAESYPIYAVQGIVASGSDSYISITTNGSELQITGALAEGETLIIDSMLITAKVVDSEGVTLRNGLPLLNELNFPTMQKGNNTVTIATEGGAGFTSLKIEARSRWR